MKLYVRVLERAGNKYKKVYNKTFEVEDYSQFLEMVMSIRRALWRKYLTKKGRTVVYSKSSSARRRIPKKRQHILFQPVLDSVSHEPWEAAV